MSYDLDWYEIVEAEHEIQNPLRAATVRALGEQLELGPESRLLDVACGTCGPALVLAQAFGCRLVCVDKSAAFLATARVRIAGAGLEERIDVVLADASEVVERHRAFDAALCLGASFVFGGLVATLERLTAAAPLVAVGEPYRHLAETVRLAETAGVKVERVLASTEQDWLAYEAHRSRTLERWLDLIRPENADSYRRRERAAQLRRRSERRGWAILVCRA